MKIISCLIVLVFNGALLLAQPSQTNLPDVIDGMRPSIARIEVTYSFTTQENPKDAQTVTFTGSGFIIDAQGDIATAGHVVSSVQALKFATDSLLTKNFHITPETFKQEIKISFLSGPQRSSWQRSEVGHL
jgi:S1-C subfamily serine protease